MGRTIDDDIAEVEEYGFKRSNFPMEYNEHVILLLSNDGYIEGDRLYMHIILICDLCGMKNSISERFPSHDTDERYAVASKMAIFDKFQSIKCSENQ